MRRLLVVGAVAAVLAAPASASEVTIVPNASIGKVRLGMTLRQVETLLGAPQLVNTRTELSHHRGYVDYGWNFSSFEVGFINTKGVLHAALIATTLTDQRTKTGIGVGTHVATLRRLLPVTCHYLYGEGELHPYRDPANQSFTYCVLRSPTGASTVFPLLCANPRASCTDFKVQQVIVRTSF